MKKLANRMHEEAMWIWDSFMPNKAKSYKAGFDNGYAMGQYHAFVEATKICNGDKLKYQSIIERQTLSDKLVEFYSTRAYLTKADVVFLDKISRSI